jgi:adenylate kinase family enzyme
MRRVLVVGGPGSGKTTWARALATALRVPHHDLDRMAHDPPSASPAEPIGSAEPARVLGEAPPGAPAPFWSWERVPDDERRHRAAALAVTDGWVADGLYAGWTAPLRDAADLIVWLDTPARITTVRVVRRALADRRRGGHDWDVSSLWRVLRGARAYRTRPPATAAQLLARDGANGRRTLAAFLAPVAGKVIRGRTAPPVDVVRRRLG